MTAPADVVLVLTDVEGSTPAWEFDHVAMEAAMQVHDAVVERVIRDAGGRLHKERGEGDSTFSVFVDPVAAVTAAGRLLVELAHAGFHLRVRVGVHAGPITTRGGELYGPTINRAARIRGLAAGGQVLLSSAVVELVADQLADDVSLVDLGEHPLRGLKDPERVYGYAHPLLEPPAPIGEAAVTPHNLPGEVDAFVGREAERTALEKALSSSRLVTIVGPGGVGKTRLALDVARAAQQPGGVWLVDVGVLTDSAQLGPGVAFACGAEPSPDGDVVAALRERITTPTLLVLDTSERHIDAVADLVADLLAAVPQLAVLATGREPLSVQGERVLRLDPLGLEATEGSSDAAALFLERLAQVAPELVEEAARSQAVVEAICAAVDGVPLAVELAAARAADVGLPDLLAALETGGEARRAVQGGRRGGPERHRSVDAAIAWSHAGLSDPEAVVFRRLALFQGGWPSSEGAMAVIGDVPGASSERVAAALLSLARRSMVVRRGERSLLLDTVRAFAAQRLDDAGERRAVEDRYVRWARERACALDADLATSGGDVVLADMPNFRYALSIALAVESADDALLLAYAMTNAWVTTGSIDEADRQLAAAIGLGGSARPRASALAAAALVAVMRGRPAEPELLAEALQLVGDQACPEAVEVWMAEAMRAEAADDDVAVRRATKQGYQVARALGRTDLLAVARHNYAVGLHPVLDHRERLELLAESAEEEAAAGSALAPARASYAHGLVLDGRAGAALDLLDALDPDDLAVALARAEASTALRDWPAALAAALSAEALAVEGGLERRQSAARLLAARACLELGELDEAGRLLGLLGEHDQDDEPLGRQLRGRLHLARGEVAEARAVASRLVHEGGSESEGGQRLLAQVLVAEGNPAEAVQAVRPGRLRAAEHGARALEQNMLEAELEALQAAGETDEVPALRERLAELSRLAAVRTVVPTT